MNDRTMARTTWCAVEALILIAFLNGSAAAQTSRGQWEVEMHGGGAAAVNSTDGTAALPGPGAAFTTIVGFLSRRESSWYFGDGTVLLNQVSNALGVGPRITASDPVLQSSLERRSDVIFGARVSRRISRRVAAELSIDYSRGALELPSASVSGADATSASFISAWRGVLATSFLFVSPVATSTVASRSREGIGVFTIAGSLACSAAVSSVRCRHAPVFESTSAHIGKSGIDTLVDATPAVQTSIPGGTASGTNPSLQFASNPPLLNASSTLSGPAISGFRTFQGTGVQSQISFSAGWSWRS